MKGRGHWKGATWEGVWVGKRVRFFAGEGLGARAGRLRGNVWARLGSSLHVQYALRSLGVAPRLSCVSFEVRAPFSVRFLFLLSVVWGLSTSIFILLTDSQICEKYFFPL